jgi:uncharacterized glyoxalase superfamily protein PhnB
MEMVMTAQELRLRIYPTFRYCAPAAMIDWLCKVFGFEVCARYGEGDRVDHAELSLGSSMIMLGGARDDAYGAMVGSAASSSGGRSVYLAIDDPDACIVRAKASGAEILEAPTDREYGSREFICRDPEGNVWCAGTYWPKVTDERG